MKAFFNSLLRERPDAVLADSYESCHLPGNSVVDRLARTRAAAESHAGQPASYEARRKYGLAMLAAGQIEEGIELLRTLMHQGEKPAPAVPVTERVTPALDLVKVGDVLGRAALIEEGWNVFEEAMKEEHDSFWPFDEISPPERMMKTGQNLRAERFLLNNLAADIAADRHADGAEFPGNHTESKHELEWLLEFYCRAGRWHDAATVLERSPDWGVSNLRAVIPSAWRYEHSNLAVNAARTFKETGRPDAARRLLGAYSERGNRSNDPAYALLVELNGEDENFGRFLDGLFARDPIEQRPLIWKAHWLLGKGRLDAAEAAARAAIRIDPLDAGQPPEDRMRAFTVLAAILAAKGDHAQADKLARIVQGTRESEKAKALSDAGLDSQAIEALAGALKTTPGVFVLEARLAMLLAENNQNDEAIPHFERAFEMMPGSTGLWSEYCYECEHIFDSPEAQAAAERILTRITVEQPDTPQAHFLLGRLRVVQHRFPEAVERFREAVRLEPDFLLAWDAFAAIGADDGEVSNDEDHAGYPGADRDAVIENIWRLDPYRRHESYLQNALAGAANLKVLWEAAQTAYQIRFETNSGSGLSLPASEAMMWILPVGNGSANDAIRLRPANLLHRQAAVHFLEYVLRSANAGDY